MKQSNNSVSLLIDVRAGRDNNLFLVIWDNVSIAPAQMMLSVSFVLTFVLHLG